MVMLYSVAFWLLLFSASTGGLLAGMALDKSFVQLPSRKRIGIAAYVEYSRAADLGAGLLWYPMLGVGAALFAIAGALAVILQHLPMGKWLAASAAAIFAVLHLFTTSRAAPKMLSLGNPASKADAERTLRRFASWQGLRLAFQIATFVFALWAVVAYAR
jgi:hypothetical protein